MVLICTPQDGVQAAVSSDGNIYPIRTSRWKNSGSKSHLLCLMMNQGMIMVERSRIFHALEQLAQFVILDNNKKSFMLFSDSFRWNILSESLNLFELTLIYL